MLEVLPTTIDHIVNLAPRIRPADKLESELLGKHPVEALIEGLAFAKESTWSFVEDGMVLCILGVHPHTLNEHIGIPWMLASEEAFTSHIRFLKQSKPVLKVLTMGYQQLLNLVHKDNDKAIHWLRWLGFEFDKDELINGQIPEGFRLFSMNMEIE